MGEEPRDRYREALDATDPTRKAALRYSPKYVFRDHVEPVAYQVWRSEQCEVIHEHCAKGMWDREFPLYPDDIEAARNLEPIICNVCEGQIAEAKTRKDNSAMTTNVKDQPDRPDPRPAPPAPPPAPAPVPPIQPQDEPLDPGHIDPPGKGGRG